MSYGLFSLPSSNRVFQVEMVDFQGLQDPQDLQGRLSTRQAMWAI